MSESGHFSRNGFLTNRGYAEVAQRNSFMDNFYGVGLTQDDLAVNLDKVVSVSALVEVEGSHVFDEKLIDEQYRRFHNGS